MTPTEHVSQARTECQAIRTDADYDAWHSKWSFGESYINLPDAQAAEIDALAEEGRQRVMRFLFPLGRAG